jgi:hypothetical protein
MRRTAVRVVLVLFTGLVVGSVFAASGFVGAAESSNDSEVTQAVKQIENEAAYLTAVLQSSGQRDVPREYVLSLLTMNYVVGHVSAPMFGRLTMVDPEAAPRGDDVGTVAERSLALGAGICGNAAATFAAILDRFGVENRSVQFYFASGNHIAVEVAYGGRWHYFDPTWGTFYRAPAGVAQSAVLSVDEIRRLPPSTDYEVANDSHAWSQVVKTIPGAARALGLDHFSRPERIVYGGEF